MIRTEVLLIVSAVLIMIFAFFIMPSQSGLSAPVDTRVELPSWMLFNREREHMEEGPEHVEHFEAPESGVEVMPPQNVPNMDVSSSLGTTPGSVSGLLSSQVRPGSSAIGELVPGK